MSMQSPRNVREWQQAVERKLAASKNGTRIAISHANDKADQVTGEFEDFKGLTPAAPIEVIYSTSTYIDQNRKRRGRVIADFPDVVLSTNAKPVVVQNYEIAGQDQSLNPLLPFQSMGTSDVSSVVTSNLLPGSTWKFKVRALGGSTVKPGVWSTEQTVTVVNDTTPPPQPSTPVVTAVSGGVKVVWDGLAAGGASMPGDFDRVEVAFGLASSPTTVFDTFYAGSMTIIPKSAYNVAHYVRLRAFDTTGNASPWSTQGVGIPVPLVDVDVIISHIDAAVTEITNIGAASILNGAINSTKLADNAVSQAKLQDQIVSLAKLDTAANTKIQKGIDDAFTAQGTANTAAGNATTALSNAAIADGKAGDAQDAADAARKLADAVILAGPSLVLNGGFETDETWPLNAAMSYDSTEKRSGTRSLKIVSTGTADAWPLNAWFDASTGRTYRVEFWVKRSGTVSITGAVAAVFQVRTSVGGTATPVAYPVPNIASLEISDTGYTRVLIDYTITTANVVQARIAPWLKRGVGNTYWVDDIAAWDITEAKEALDAANAAQQRADDAFDDAYDANVLAGQAQTAANGKNNIYYAAAKPAGSGFADGDTVFIRTAPGAPITEQWKWIKTGPSTGSWNQETIGHQVIASVDLGKATIGELNGIYVKAFSLSADQIKIGSGTNLFPDPKMLDTAGWPVTAGLTYGGVGTGKNGQGSMLIAASGTQVGTYYSNNDPSRRIPVSPNSSYRLSVWVRSDQAIPVGGASIYARQYPIDGSAFNYTTPSLISNNTIIPGTNTWTEITGVVTTGAVASGLVIGLYKQTTAPGNVRFSDPTIEVMGVGRLIVDGTIQGNHIMTNSIAARHMTITDLTNFAPSVAESPTDWSLTGQMTIAPTGLDPSGSRFSVIDGTGESRAWGPYMAVSPGENLWMGATLYRASGNTPAAYLRYEFSDANKVGLAGGSGTNYVSAPQPSTSAGGTRFEGSALVPAGAAYARWHVIVSSGTGSTGFYNIVGRRRLAGELIIDGTVTSDKVATNGITAKQILVGDFQNFALGSDFEDATAVPWNLHGLHTITTAQKKSGTSSLRLAAMASGSAGSILTADMRVKEGEQYYFKLHAYIDAAFNGASNSKLRISDQTNTPVLGFISFTGIPRSAWTTVPLETTVTVPAGVTSLTVTLNNDNTAGTAYIDDIQIRRVSEASLIMNLGVEKLTASAANMVQATIDKLWTDVVRSRRMTTDMMVVGRGVNGLVDEFFDAADIKAYRHTMAGAWGAWGNNATLALNWYGGALTAGTSRSFFFDTVGSYDKNSYIPVEPGQVWLLKAQYTSAVSGPRGSVKVVKRDGTTSYTVTGWTKRDGTSNLTYGVAGTAQVLERIYTVPADVAYIMPALQFDATCTSAFVYAGATLTNMATSSLIVDGAVTARNLTVTEEMWTNILHFKLIGGDEIDANSIIADTGKIGILRGGILINDAVTTGVLKADAITSKHTLTGATVQTLVTANRGIKLTGGNFKAYDGGGGETFSVIGSTGAVTMTGVLRTGLVGATKYAKLSSDATGGRLDFYTGITNERGYVFARNEAGVGKMTLGYADSDEPGVSYPVLTLSRDEGRLSFGGRNVKIDGTEIMVDGNGVIVKLRGGLELQESDTRVRFRYDNGGANSILGSVGQRPETSSAFADFEVRADTGNLRLSGAQILGTAFYSNTTSNAANMYVGSDGKVWRSTSASKYKADQQLLTVPDSLLDIQMKDWVDKNQYALWESMVDLPRPLSDRDQEAWDAIDITREPGVIAEDVEAAGGEQYTIYGPDGAIEGVKYERLALAQIQVLKRQLAEAMEQIGELRAAINA